ncbi:hypothetical protein [Chachezhania sediminis]|uniref:hypothetical protein n=1 Tax=Chachezhania sediminis TaxID=2599291 RepID=UPI00131DA3FF|nr:hypothetical protein [Chachezhania sediminis]
MKYTWEEQDIIDDGDGRRIWSSTDACNGECIIAYRRNPDWNRGDSGSVNQYAVVSLTDGMVYTEFMSAEDLAAKLNDHGYRPMSVIEDFSKYVRYETDFRGAPKTK